MKLPKKSYEVRSVVNSRSTAPAFGHAVFRHKTHAEDHYTYNSWTAVHKKKEIKDETKNFVPTLYTRRWYYMTLAILINASDGALWICYASVTNMAATYYNVSVNAINWLSMIFFIVYLPIIFVSMWINDKMGSKAGVFWAGGTNLAGSVIRLFGTFSFVPPAYRFPITIAGQTVAALTQPFCMCMPTKISQEWFPESERAISTTLISLSNLAGSMIASVVSPIIAATPEQVPLMNFVMCGFGIFVGLVGFTMLESRPPTPPSLSAAQTIEEKGHSSFKEYLQELKKLLTNKQYLLLNLTAASTGVGTVYTLLTVLQQMLCSFNYSNNFSGLCTALMIAGGILGSIAISPIANKTKKFEEIVTVGFSLSVLSDIALILMCNIRDIHFPIAIICVICGILNLGIYPVCLEVSVEVTYPIEQSLSAGLIAFWQQIQGAAFVPLITSVGVELNAYQMRHQTCTVGTTSVVYDSTNGALCLLGLITFFDILLLVFFKPIFKRREFERIKMLQSLQLVNNAFYKCEERRVSVVAEKTFHELITTEGIVERF